MVLLFKSRVPRFFGLIGLCCFFVFLAGACTEAKKSDSPFFKTRGLIFDVNDLSTVDWPRRAKEAGITTLATHITPSQVAQFYASPAGMKFRDDCRKYGIAIEHELHAMGDLLPRELFGEDSTMFRMNEKGQRVRESNLCAHSAKALDIVCQNAVKFSKLLPSTTGRYFYWIDDGSPMCKCDQCAGFTESEQALILENAIVKALRKEIDPAASLAHLAYHNTLPAPQKVKPEEGIFLEFAPFHRSWSVSLKDTAATGWDQSIGISHGEYLRQLDENLKVFPVETAQVLEYWLDVSLASRWKKPAVQLPWNEKVFQDDLEVYAGRGIRNITSFGVYIDDEYLKNYPDVSFVNEYGKGLETFRPTEKK